MMITRGIDVKELVNSQLFYPNFWKKYSLFSQYPDTVMIQYNNDLDELEAEDPFTLFKNSAIADDDTISNIKSAQFQQKRVGVQSPAIDEQAKNMSQKASELFEMQYNYILMEEIQGNNKIEVSRVLSECPDVGIFEQEAIQNIIDYKWTNYAREFFLMKFIFYAIFLLFYYIDLESLHNGIDLDQQED